MKELKTKRLSIVPRSDEELAACIATEQDEHMRKAYAEMLEGCRAHPKERLWYTDWRISLRDGGETVGSIGFKGPAINGAVEIGYGIDETYMNRGYASEAAKAAADWAFSTENVYFVMAETEPGNAASQRVLEKLGFTQAGEGVEGPRFEKERPKVSWLSIFMCLGLSVGLSLGVATENMGTSMSIGLCLGVALGVSLDAQDKKKRAELKAARINE